MDILQHNVLGFEVSVYDFVLVQILDSGACRGTQQIYHMKTR